MINHYLTYIPKVLTYDVELYINMYFILAKASFSVCQPKTLQFKISSQQVSCKTVTLMVLTRLSS